MQKRKILIPVAGLALLAVVLACLYSIIKVSLGLGGKVLLFFGLVFSLSLFVLLCISVYHGLGINIEFQEETLAGSFFVYKHLQTRYDRIYPELVAFEKEARKLSRVQQLLDTGRVYSQTVRFDDPDVLEDPEEGRVCVGLTADSQSIFEENVVDQLEGNPGLTSRATLPEIKALVTRFPNKSIISVAVFGISVRTALRKFLDQHSVYHQDIFREGRLSAPMVEVYRENEIICYVPVGEDAARMMKLTQFKEPAYRGRGKTKTE